MGRRRWVGADGSAPLTLTLTLTRNIIATMARPQMARPQMVRPQMTPQQAVAVYNPMNPKEDAEEEFFWRVAATGHAQPTLQDVMDSMYKDKFEYASSEYTTQTVGLHLFRRKRSTMVDQDNHVEKLRLQVEAFKLKIESDKLQIEVANLCKERADALKVLAKEGISLVDQQD